jgi:outer membrane beta-barrel protein
MKKLLSITILLSCVSAFSADVDKSDLEKKLDSLNIPSDKVTPLVTEENLYVINDRYSSLYRRHEFTFMGARNFNADSHLETEQISVSYRMHLNSRWSFGARYSEFYNELSASGKQLYKDKSLLPDSDYAIKSSEAFVNFNTVYGKLRLTKDTIVYFDQYIALGYGTISLARGDAPQYTVDLGFSFWVGKHLSARTGMKNELYVQKKLNGESNVNNMMGYFEIGYLL